MISGNSILIPIEDLGLPVRAKNALKRSNVHALQDVLQLVSKGFDGVPGMGKKLKIECLTIIHVYLSDHDLIAPADLSDAIDITPNKIEINAKEIVLQSFGSDLATAFPSFVEEFIDRERAKTRDRDKTIIRKRFGLADGKVYTLDDLGAYYDITRERIRQIEAKIIAQLSCFIRGSHKPASNWRLSQDLVDTFNQILIELSDGNFLVLDAEFSQIVEQRCGNDISGPYRQLFLELCGYKELPTSFSGFRGRLKKSWYKVEKGHRSEIESLYAVLDNIYDSNISVPLFDIVVRAKKKRKSVTKESVNVALKACDDLEINDDNVRVKFLGLRNHADRAYRVLEEAGDPLHFGEIVRQINERLQGDVAKHASVRAVTGQLVSDPRFIPIGKSGIWSLAQWGQKNITIVEAIESVLHKSGRPLDFKEVCAGVGVMRPDASIRSIRTYLCNTPDKFSRVAGGAHALIGWKLPTIKKATRSKIVSNEEFFHCCVDVFGEIEQMPLADLVRGVSTGTGLSDASVRQRLNLAEWLRTDQQGSKRLASLSGVDYDSTRDRPKELLRNKIQSEVVSILQSRPNMPFKKGELYRQVRKSVPCIKATFYSYLKGLSQESVEQYKDGNDHLVVYRHTELVERISVNLDSIRSIEDQELRGTLERAVELLCHETVDIGLLELGRTLESVLKDYLVEAQGLGALTVHQRDLRTFASMIEYISREQVVPKSYQLSILREERNARAHGEPLDVGEKQVLFNRAHFLADLFVKYVVLFHEKKCELQRARL